MAQLTADKIYKLLEEGESQTVEFKTSYPSDNIIGKILASFANTDGGILVIGVSENKISGLTDFEAEHASRHLDRIASSLLPTPATLGAIKVDNKNIVYAIIEKAPKYLTPILTSSGEFFIRKGEKVIQASQENLTSLSEKKTAEVAKEGKESKVFVAMSFREEEEPSLVDYFKAMERGAAATQLPIIISRVDLVEGDYEISQEIMNQIDTCDIVIADLTLNSRNVYFELGYARGKKKKIIQTARANTLLEFDIRNWRTIFYKNATELEQRIKEELKAAYVEVNKKAG